MIPQRNLSLLSNRLFREQGGRRIPEAVLQRDYCLAWFLATLATHPLREHLAFKGGTALKRCHFANYRFSEDLDLTLLQAMEFPAIQTSLEEIFAALTRVTGYRRSLRGNATTPNLFAPSCTLRKRQSNSLAFPMCFRPRRSGPLQLSSV